MSTAYFLIGKTLGKYQVVRHLGHGGMAEVYLGEQVHLNRQVAIKILHPFLAEEKGFVNRFQREARIVATLRHPNIVQVYDFDFNEEFGVYYMVMEYIEGPTLRERLERAEISQQEGVRIAAAIADALEYAHRRQMVHRDIKPANILFTEDNQPVLTDFGIARMLSLTGLTASGAMVGTPAYMAPEIGIGQPGTALSDIYSLGVVLYQMITGQLPFDAEVPMALVMKHINDPVPSPSRLVASLSPDLEAVIVRMLAKQPEQRQSSAGDVATALRGVMGWEAPASAVVNATTASRSAFRQSSAADGGTQPPSTLPDLGEGDEPEQPLLRRVTPRPTNPPDSSGEAAARRRGRLMRVLRWAAVLCALLLFGLAGWSAAIGQVPPFLQQLLGSGPAVPAVISVGALSEATETPSPTRQIAPTWTPAPRATPTPTIAANCVHRAEVLRIHTTPADSVLPPGATLRADITLRNGGACAWPVDTRLALTSGEALGAATSVLLRPLVIGDQVQLQLYLRAPEKSGAVRSVWEVQLPDGRAISSPLTFALTIGDLATFTPVPTTETPPTPTPTTPLTILAPELREWAEDAPTKLWRGALTLKADGGSGTYRFYRDAIRADTEITGDTLAFEWQRCAGFPLTLIVASGAEIARWQGTIAYPAPERCQ